MNELSLVENALSVPQIIEQRKLVLSAMKDAMTDNHHFGKIPGCGDKPTLLQPGAQLLCSLFRLASTYDITQRDLPSGHIEYLVKCALSHGSNLIANGVGVCSSMESKYRFRNAAPITEDTGDPVPRAFWDNPDKKDALAKLSPTYDGRKCGTKKIDGQWRIVIITGGDDGKVENANPADTFNTVLKIAKKRAYVDATITATACSDLFTQDLEDIAENLGAYQAPENAPEAPRERNVTPPAAQPEQPKEGDSKTLVDVGITAINHREGETKGRKWIAYFVEFSDGTSAGTFSDTAHNFAKDCAEQQIDSLTVNLLAGKQRKWEIVSIEIPGTDSKWTKETK